MVYFSLAMGKPSVLQLLRSKETQLSDKCFDYSDRTNQIFYSLYSSQFNENVNLKLCSDSSSLFLDYKRTSSQYILCKDKEYFDYGLSDYPVFGFYISEYPLYYYKGYLMNEVMNMEVMTLANFIDTMYNNVKKSGLEKSEYMDYALVNIMLSKRTKTNHLVELLYDLTSRGVHNVNLHWQINDSTFVSKRNSKITLNNRNMVWTHKCYNDKRK